MTGSLGFAVAAAVLLGSSDLLAARAARGASSLTVTRTVVLVSLVLSPLLLLVGDWTWVAADVLLGASSGLAMITGLMLIYRGYAVARMGVVAPLSSVLLATVPIVWDVVFGRRPGTLGWVGIAIGLIALVLTTATPSSDGSVAVGAVLGLTSGVAFGAAYTLMGEVGEGSGLVPVIAQRTAGSALLLVVWFVRRGEFIATGSSRRPAMVAGGLALSAIACLQSAFQGGASGPVAVAASQFASVAVVLSVIVDGERMRWWQAIGVASTAVAVGCIAVG